VVTGERAELSISLEETSSHFSVPFPPSPRRGLKSACCSSSYPPFAPLLNRCRDISMPDRARVTSVRKSRERARCDHTSFQRAPRITYYRSVLLERARGSASPCRSSHIPLFESQSHHSWHSRAVTLAARSPQDRTHRSRGSGIARKRY